MTPANIDELTASLVSTITDTEAYRRYPTAVARHIIDLRITMSALRTLVLRAQSQ